MTSPEPAEVARLKALLRAAHVSARAGLSAADRATRAAALGAVFAAALAPRLPGAGNGRCVAAYLSIGTEPGTGPLIATLAGLEVHTLVPIVTESADLDWTAISVDASLRAGARGTLEPTSKRLGPEAVAEATIVLVPALAVDRHGNRLGRGGGFYDRALWRVRSGALVLAVVHDDEVIDSVPVEPHDRPVHGVLTPGGVLLFPSAPHA